MLRNQLLKETDVTELQVPLLLRLIDLMPFAESMTQNEVSLFVPARNGRFLRVRHHVQGDKELDKQISFVEEQDAMLWQQLINTGEAISGFQEREHGQLALLQAYAVVDNGGKVIGGISFVNPRIDGTDERERIEWAHILTETAYMAILVPCQNQSELYVPISYQDGVIIFDEAGTILYGNNSAIRLVDLLGFDRRLVGSSIFGSTLKLSLVKQVLQERRGAVMDEIYDGMVIGQTVIPVVSSRFGNRSILLLQDKTIVSRKEQELLVKNSVIKEIHHRVKNNLQTVAGLLRMEARRSDSTEVKLALQEGISRIESMALVHDIVSHYDEDYVELRRIYDELSRLLKISMLRNTSSVTFEYNGDEVQLRSNRAGYVSLILNELISNSLEHGIGDGTGLIYLRVKDGGETVSMSLQDSGKGFPEEFDLRQSKRLGLQIINNLVVNELRGSLSITNVPNGGALVTIDFIKGD